MMLQYNHDLIQHTDFVNGNQDIIISIFRSNTFKSIVFVRETHAQLFCKHILVWFICIKYLTHSTQCQFSFNSQNFRQDFSILMSMVVII